MIAAVQLATARLPFIRSFRAARVGRHSTTRASWWRRWLVTTHTHISIHTHTHTTRRRWLVGWLQSLTCSRSWWRCSLALHRLQPSSMSISIKGARLTVVWWPFALLPLPLFRQGSATRTSTVETQGRTGSHSRHRAGRPSATRSSTSRIKDPHIPTWNGQFVLGVSDPRTLKFHFAAQMDQSRFEQSQF